ncbi:flagellar filament capping protein FliD [Novosphingobium sp.]|uniref:flagellar filament capping protein FliD n=1 Tax=Novosphingobium sp. TaxID=1874826 RepID=UPI00333F6D74
MTTISSTSTSGTTSTATGNTSSSGSSSTTSSNNATTALLTALGASGTIDATGLATQLAQAQYAAQVDQLNTRNTTLGTQISEASTLMNMMSSLTTSLDSLITAGQLSASPQIANSQVATVSAGTVPGSGTATLEVTALAQGQTLASPSVSAATSDFGSGSLTIAFGTVSGSNFTADATRSPVTIAIAQGSSLAQIAQAITSAGAGVSAYVATNANGQQLVISGPQGAANGFTISATEDAADPGLAQFAYDPASTATGGATLAAAAGDASYKLNGVQRTATSNAITDAAPGISLNLTGLNRGSPTTISFSDPTSAIATSMSNLVTALNSITTQLNTDTAVGAALNNNPGARAMARALSSLSLTTIMPNAASGAPRTLSDLGLSTNRDGSFALDSTLLNKTLHANPAAVGAMFTTGLHGVYATVYNLSRSLNDSTNGNSLAGSIKSMQTQQTSISSRLSKLTDQQSTLRTQLIKQFSALNAVVTADKSTQSFLTQQVALWTNKTA